MDDRPVDHCGLQRRTRMIVLGACGAPADGHLVPSPDGQLRPRLAPGKGGVPAARRPRPSLFQQVKTLWRMRDPDSRGLLPARFMSARPGVVPLCCGHGYAKSPPVIGDGLLRQGRAATISRYSSSVKARRVSVVTLPALPTVRATFAAAVSSGASMIVTMSYRPMVR